MSTGRNIDKIKKNKNKAISMITDLLENIFSNDPSKADKLSYWIQDYVNFLNFEKQFKPERLKSYKRGDVIKVNFGFRIGCELGGLHYAVVIDKHNAMKSPTITVVPLTSLKPGVNINTLSSDRIYLGEEIINNILKKCNNRTESLTQEFNDIKKKSPSLSYDEFSKIKKEWDKKYRLTQKIYQEVKKMKLGSIASVGQITTISKLRIQDPKSSSGILTGIRISEKNLNAIDKKISELFIHN